MELEGSVLPPGQSNHVSIAAFTTAHARQPLPLYNYLGDLTDKLGVTPYKSLLPWVQNFMRTKPKHTKKKLLKVKGISLMRKACERVNFDSVRNLVEGFRDNVLNSPRKHHSM